MTACEAFLEVCLLGNDLGLHRLDQRTGCWRHEVDANWTIHLNPHAEACDSGDVRAIPPRSIYIEWCGWPAGVIDAGGGCIAAGDCANEDSFIAAVQKARAALTGAA